MAGPEGAPGEAIPLLYETSAPNASNTTLLSQAGFEIQASCGGNSNSPSTNLQGRALSNGGVVRVTDVESGSSLYSNNLAQNTPFSLTPGAAVSNNVLSFLSGDGHSIITGQYGIANGGLGLAGVDCLVFGTVQTAQG